MKITVEQPHTLALATLHRLQVKCTLEKAVPKKNGAPTLVG